MNNNIERNLGEQPISRIIKDCKLRSQDLVNNSPEQISYKMVSRAIKGRRLTPHIQLKILKALNQASKKNYALKDLFNY